jgi:hypothetical protein
MTAIYHGQPVTVLRPVIPGDDAFKSETLQQVLIRTSEGAECVVPTTDLIENDPEVSDTGDEVTLVTASSTAPNPFPWSPRKAANAKPKAKKAAKKR